MGFIYTKPLSIEGVFSKFDTNGDGIISSEEKKAAKNMDVFTSFKAKKGMTLESFENENRDVFAKYERIATHAYDKQKARIVNWLEAKQNEMDILKDYELAELERAQKELEQERDELELKLTLQKRAKEFGINISSEKLSKLSPIMIEELIQMFATLSDDVSGAIRSFLEKP